ncbi:hypothetical protein GGF31_003237, partial [Allomyces arbusculus]
RGLPRAPRPCPTCGVPFMARTTGAPMCSRRPESPRTRLTARRHAACGTRRPESPRTRLTARRHAACGTRRPAWPKTRPTLSATAT